MDMKKIVVLLMLFALVITQAMACHIEITSQSDTKKCKPGDELILAIKLTLTHRNCKVSVQDTKFKYDGIQILGATEWKQESQGVYERQVKVKVLNDNKKKIILSATRSCDKDGGYWVFTLDQN